MRYFLHEKKYNPTEYTNTSKDECALGQLIIMDWLFMNQR